MLGELKVLRSRVQLIYLAVALDVICALFVALTIVIAFVEAFVGMNLAWLIALLFVAAMLAFIASLAVFLREIFLAVGYACATAGRRLSLLAQVLAGTVMHRMCIALPCLTARRRRRVQRAMLFLSAAAGRSSDSRAVSLGLSVAWACEVVSALGGREAIEDGCDCCLQSLCGSWRGAAAWSDFF